MADVISNIVDKVFLLVFLLREGLLPEDAGLDEVGVGYDALELGHGSDPVLFVGLRVLRRRGRGVERRREVVRSAPEVAVSGGGAIPDQGIKRFERPVDRELDKVDTESVALRIRVRKGTSLQD